ncbi:MAG TPA: substrate-binding domain-containing protein [Sphingomicrobium sp.]|nr:substrate-binding domain-containing protein [Sphingomicrobium sp.]
MIRGILRHLLAFAALVSPVAAAPPAPAAQALSTLPDYRPVRQVQGTIIIWGHGSSTRDFMGQLARRWIAEFQRMEPAVHFEYRMYGTSSAIGALAVGAGNLAILGEEISPAAERMFERIKGYKPTKIEIANGSLSTNYFDYAHQIFVNRANPLAKLDARQLEAIFGAEHRCTQRNIRTWGDLGLGGAWAHRQIHPYAWKTDTDFALFFRERILCGSHRWNPATSEVVPIKGADGTQYELGQQIIDSVARDPDGIGISNVRFRSSGVKPLAIAWTREGPYVEASDSTLIDRSYALVRIVPAYVDRPPGKKVDPAVAEFLRFILSRQGQTALVEESGYLPLDGKEAEKSRQWLQ